MTVAALADFGSTFTKVSLVDRTSGRLLARAQAPTTVRTDLMEGYAVALAEAERIAGGVEIELRLAASSAAGGLRIAAVGLVGDLTAAAARQAALNAGGRVDLVLAGTLGAADAARLARARPDMVLFAGGTDGGQAEMVLANARAIAGAAPGAYVVVACNDRVATAVAAEFAAAHAQVDVVANVMPAIGVLDIEPARAAITRAFVYHVIGGKGLSRSTEFAHSVAMPTPEAVLAATALLAAGSEGEPGVGDVVVVDVGGATTDVHSVARRPEAGPGTDAPLLPLSPVMRTVQGDLGVRVSAAGPVAADRAWVVAAAARAGLGENTVDAMAAEREHRPELMPTSPAAEALDAALATACITHALRRHCGRLRTVLRPGGPPRFVQDGPDLREAPLVVVTGGVVALRPDGLDIARAALDRREAQSLAPRAPRVAVDRSYLLAAAGLLSTVDPGAAHRLLRREVVAAAVSGATAD